MSDESDLPIREPADADQIDAEIASVMQGLRESVYTVVLAFLMDRPPESPDEFYSPNVGSQTFTVSGFVSAEEAADDLEHKLADQLEDQHGRQPYAVWTTVVFVGRAVQARTPALETDH